ncbi:Rab family GTPase [Entamoeba marina]
MRALNKQKVVFLGDSSVGKTCIIGRFMTGDFDTGYDATIGTDFSTKTMTIKNTSIQLQIWDTAGQERYRSLIPSYIRDSSAAVIVYDINNRQSFEDIDKWVEDVRSIETGEIFLFILHKKEAMSKAEYHQCDCFETSAKTNVNVTELFMAITEKLMAIKPTRNDSIETIEIKKKTDGGGCC